MRISEIVSAAFMQASVRQKETNQRWITASHRIGGLLPGSALTSSVQAIGHLDTLLRSMEDDVVEVGPEELHTTASIGIHTYRTIFSDTWIGSAYEIVRLLKQRKLAPDTEEFARLKKLLALVRMPLEKHEIEDDRRLSAPLQLRPMQAREDDCDTFYVKNDLQRAHILPRGISSSGSDMWCVIDVQDQTSKWIERRVLSNMFLDVFAKN